MRKIDSFLRQVQDGTWHSLETLAENSRIQKKKLKKLARLLAKPEVIEYLPEKGWIKIREKWRRLLNGTDEARRDRKAAVGTIVLRSMGTIRVQGVRITNLLGTELEVSIRADEKLKEIALSVVEED